MLYKNKIRYNLKKKHIRDKGGKNLHFRVTSLNIYVHPLKNIINKKKNLLTLTISNRWHSKS